MLGLIYTLLDCSRVYNNTVQTFKEEVSSIKDAYQAFIIFTPPLSICVLSEMINKTTDKDKK